MTLEAITSGRRWHPGPRWWQRTKEKSREIIKKSHQQGLVTSWMRTAERGEPLGSGTCSGNTAFLYTEEDSGKGHADSETAT